MHIVFPAQLERCTKVCAINEIPTLILVRMSFIAATIPALVSLLFGQVSANSALTLTRSVFQIDMVSAVRGVTYRITFQLI